MKEGTGSELYHKLNLRAETLSEHLSLDPKVADLPAKMLCDALLNHLIFFNPYRDGFGLAHSARDFDRFNFSPPIVESWMI